MERHGFEIQWILHCLSRPPVPLVPEFLVFLHDERRFRPGTGVHRIPESPRDLFTIIIAGIASVDAAVSETLSLMFLNLVDRAAFDSLSERDFEKLALAR